jgi:hypothetical protein
MNMLYYIKMLPPLDGELYLPQELIDAASVEQKSRAETEELYKEVRSGLILNGVIDPSYDALLALKDQCVDQDPSTNDIAKLFLGSFNVTFSSDEPKFSDQTIAVDGVEHIITIVEQRKDWQFMHSTKDKILAFLGSTEDGLCSDVESSSEFAQLVRVLGLSRCELVRAHYVTKISRLMTDILAFRAEQKIAAIKSTSDNSLTLSKVTNYLELILENQGDKRLADLYDKLTSDVLLLDRDDPQFIEAYLRSTNRASFMGYEVILRSIKSDSVFGSVESLPRTASLAVALGQLQVAMTMSLFITEPPSDLPMLIEAFQKAGVTCTNEDLIRLALTINNNSRLAQE